MFPATGGLDVWLTVHRSLTLVNFQLDAQILIYLCIRHLLKSSTCFEHYPANLQQVYVVIVYMQPLVSSLSAGDCPVHRLRKDFNKYIMYKCRSQWPRGLRRRSAAARLLRSWVRIPPGAWMCVCCECRVLSGRGLCDELITRPEESYRLSCVVVCDLEASRMRRP